MEEKMLTSFADELEKIAADAAIKAVTTDISTGSSAMKPAVIPTGQKPVKALKTQPKPTNYTVVNTQPPRAAYGTAAGSRAVPPPPVRT